MAGATGGALLCHGLVWALPGLAATALTWALATGLAILHDIRAELRSARQAGAN